ncbi:fatty acid synthase alpha subunit Lsd1 [Cystobasidiomycetes sp. EMM_F5]
MSSVVAAVSAAVNGIGGGRVNGANGDASSDNSTTTTTLLLIHPESNTRTAIPIENSLLSHALNLREEFIDSLGEGPRGLRLKELANEYAEQRREGEADDGESPVSTPPTPLPLLLSAYWLDYLVNHIVTRTSSAKDTRNVLASSLDHFQAAYLVDFSIDIHQAANQPTGQHSLDLEERKTVIASYVEAVGRVYPGDDGHYGPRGRMWREGEETRVYAVFGGQGSNEYYWDEMEVGLSIGDPLATANGHWR